MVNRATSDDVPKVTITAFNTKFEDLLPGHAQDLKTLESEGAIYHEFADRGEDGEFSNSFTRYRVEFLPAEIVEYVQAHIAKQQFQKAYDKTHDFTAAVLAISEERFRERVVSYGSYGNSRLYGGGTIDNRGCFASFAGPELEALICGILRERYEPAPSLGSNSNKNELVIRALRSVAVSARRLSNRSHGRENVAVANEYDVQDLSELALRALFSDVEREEWTPKNAGQSKRIDIVIPSISSVVECKYVRDTAHARKIADELRIDFECYHEHPACRELFAYIYDPNSYIDDPEAFCNALSGLRQKRSHQFSVYVLIN